MEKLISMTNFVFKVQEEYSFEESTLKLIYNYGKFLKQPLTLGMFVPCDLDGNLLEEPQAYRTQICFDEWDMVYDEKECKEYQEAKERVLFEGFEIKQFQTGTKYLELKDGDILCTNQFGNFKFRKYQITEDLIKYELVLTPTAKKQIGL